MATPASQTSSGEQPIETSHLALPTTEALFAMVVLEAMAHGLPVVVSCAHHCCITAGLRQQVNARVLETPSHDAQLACAEGALLDAPGLRARLSLGAWQYAQDFGWEGLALAQERGYLKSHPLDCPVESWQPGTVPVAHWSCRAKTAQRQ